MGNNIYHPGDSKAVAYEDIRTKQQRLFAIQRKEKHGSEIIREGGLSTAIYSTASGHELVAGRDFEGSLKSVQNSVVASARYYGVLVQTSCFDGSLFVRSFSLV